MRCFEKYCRMYYSILKNFLQKTVEKRTKVYTLTEQKGYSERSHADSSFRRNLKNHKIIVLVLRFWQKLQIKKIPLLDIQPL